MDIFTVYAAVIAANVTCYIAFTIWRIPEDETPTSGDNIFRYGAVGMLVGMPIAYLIATLSG